MTDDKTTEAAEKKPSDAVVVAAHTPADRSSGSWLWAIVIVALAIAVVWLGWQHSTLKKQISEANDALAQAQQAMSSVQSSVDGLEADRAALKEALLGLVEEQVLVAKARLEAGNPEGAAAGLARAREVANSASELTGSDAADGWAEVNAAITDLESRIAPGVVPGDDGTKGAPPDETSDEAGSDGGQSPGAADESDGTQ